MKRSHTLSSFCTLVACAVLGSSSIGCMMMQVEAEVEQVDITQPNITFEGIPAQLKSLGVGATRQTFTQTNPTLNLPDQLTSEIRTLQVTLTAKSGIKDFDFLNNLRVTMVDDSGKQAPVEIIAYTKTAPMTGPVLAMPAKNPVNVLDHWKSKNATFTMEIEGVLPDTEWVVDLTMSFAGKVKWKPLN